MRGTACSVSRPSALTSYAGPAALEADCFSRPAFFAAAAAFAALAAFSSGVFSAMVIVVPDSLGDRLAGLGDADLVAVGLSLDVDARRLVRLGVQQHHL